MTPQEKANELVNKYFLEIEGADRYAFNLPSMNLYIAKECALIAVDEITSVIDAETNFKTWEFYKQVKQELEKL